MKKFGNWVERKWHKGVNWVKKAFKKLGKFITDLPKKALKFLEALVTGKYEKNFKTIDIRKNIKEELIPDKVTLSGHIKLKSKLVFSVKVALDRISSSVRVSAEYSFGARLDFQASNSTKKEKTYNLWSGVRKSYIIAGLIEVNWKPKIDLATSVEASYDASAHLEASYYGGTSIAIIADTKKRPILQNQFQTPSLKQRDFSYDIQGTAEAKASVALVFSVEFGVYHRLLSAQAGASLGIDFEAEGGFKLLGRSKTPIVYIDKFDSDLKVALPLSASAFWGKYKTRKTNIFEHSEPFLRLPSAKIKTEKDLMCELGEGSNGNNLASIDLTVSKINSDAIIPNGFSDGNVKWYLGDGLDGWSLNDSSGDSVTITNPNVVTPTSPIPDGEIYVTLQPKIPPLLKKLHPAELGNIIENDDGQVECIKAGTCTGDKFFDNLSAGLSSNFNSNVFLSQPPDPNAALVPSSVYKFEDLMSALKKLQNSGEQFQMWLGEFFPFHGFKTKVRLKIISINSFLFFKQSI